MKESAPSSQNAQIFVVWKLLATKKIGGAGSIYLPIQETRYWVWQKENKYCGNEKKSFSLRQPWFKAKAGIVPRKAGLYGLQNAQNEKLRQCRKCNRLKTAFSAPGFPARENVNSQARVLPFLLSATFCRMSHATCDAFCVLWI